MTRAEAWCVQLAALGVGGTGLVYAWMRYLCRPADELALVNHPLEPSVQHLHVWLAPALVFALGLVWSEHVWKRIRAGHPVRRPTGLALALLAFPMVLSGAWVQLAGSAGARTVASALHTVSGALFCLVLGVHLLMPRRALREGPTPSPDYS